ncbi:L-serine ammonia-lyase, iron-sulfur-dependent subunit beta [Clostridium sp. YIM B02515]|uniref:L-serine deaminase n=1 Tax=Clostridium rhizosphaerae TaxID=2803861 RepID=A0ABS1TBQ3_9CLOT|nr:L-serine ammonia-lyase, iron-sulfur-dependent subunit beta [Clostridium rhizosphaerae]MBL4936785.1 L-serine ammonia-lyase, iron-sulfur-dependent subunit beta [Clostridium rhizosphaerae]
MRNYSAFDILGPAMIGPSSSHTAGAARLAKVARIIAGKDIKEVKFLLHGSFAKTYRGHGTDRALAAGILGMEPWDERLRAAIDIAEIQGLKMEFIEADLGDEHPNTVKFLITTYDDNVVEVMGSSIGGGNIIIKEVDGEKIEFTGEYPTLIIKHVDVPGIISKVSSIIYEAKINIATMKVYRSSRGSEATMIFETDSDVPQKLIQDIIDIGNIKSIRAISPIVER